ncbi:conserved protein of unknown function [Burkholderia multivorans]
MGEKRFRALQTDSATSASRTTRNGPDEHDYLHIFSHPDCDRRLWHSTRSADPAHDARALAGLPADAGLPPVGNFTPP